MSIKSDSSRQGGIGVAGLLGCIFVALKLTGFINWSWWWVTAPFWGGLVVAFLGLATFLLVAGGVLLTAFLVALFFERGR